MVLEIRTIELYGKRIFRRRVQKTPTSDRFESVIVHLHRDVLKRIYESELDSIKDTLLPPGPSSHWLPMPSRKPTSAA
jgi:hypothetical protein